ncbi:hypothetical protein JTB14_003256 [Gonioctena quinquepunctata]|nr:hypothetical protein JTB14_003256 [Gonioctena quinquepunctata]
MKGAWRKTLTDFELRNLRLSTVPKYMFSSLLKKSLNEMDTVTARVVKPNETNQIQFETSKLESVIKRNSINSFRSTGIHPADREQVFKKWPPEQVADPTPIVENALTAFLKEQRYGDAVLSQRRRTRLEVQPGCSISTAAYGQESDDDEDGELGIEDRPASVSSICDVGEEEANSEDFEVGQFILGTFYSQRGKKAYKYVRKILGVDSNILVVGSKSAKKSKRLFRLVPDDTSELKASDIMKSLPNHSLEKNDYNIFYKFGIDIEVLEM